VPTAVQRFACTACGKCCNRSPEVELSEAAALVDVFVFRLMFRLYALPRTLADYLRGRAPEANASEAFYQKKRLLSANAALKRPLKIRRDGKAVEFVQCLTMSALSLDLRAGACCALEDDGRCSIHARRPYTCRTVPFHYSRVEASAEADLKAFVATEGYQCDTSETAPIVLRDRRIVDEDMLRDRAEGLALSESDARWRSAIVQRMKSDESLPTLEQVATNASVGALTSSMRIAWEIAAEAGLIAADECRSLVAAQLALMECELAEGRCPPESRQTLLDMRAEYAAALGNGA
jgi:Fe-S-cluster containining protein